MFKNILIATDGSELAQKAATNGIKFAKSIGARVTAVAVSVPFYTYDVLNLAGVSPTYAEDVRASEWLGDVAKVASARGLRCQVVQVDETHPHEGIIKVATERKCDLIVMASHGRMGIAAALLGSVTAKVIAHTPVPVLVYH